MTPLNLPAAEPGTTHTVPDSVPGSITDTWPSVADLPPLPTLIQAPPPEIVAALPWDGNIPLHQMLTYVTPAYGGDTWTEAFTCLLTSAPDREIIATLLTEITGTPRTGEQGSPFREPIRVGQHDPCDWDDDSTPCPTNPYLGNGMHRLTAATLAGLDHVPVTTADADADAWWYFEAVVRIEGFDELSDTQRAALDLNFDTGLDLEFLSYWLRSFRLTEDVWIENVSAGCSMGVSKASWLCPPHLADDLATELTRRTEAAGLRLHIVASRTISDADLSEEIDSGDLDSWPYDGSVPGLLRRG